MKKILAGFMAALVFLTVTIPAYAYSGRSEARADELYKAGLFNGYGINEYGRVEYGLDKKANRAQAITMLVRIIGKAEEAAENANSYQTPFTDVPDWCKAAVGYAYENGLTSGISNTLFGPDRTVSCTEFLAFALRALGYQSNRDFTWDTIMDMAETVGIAKAGEYRDNTNFERGNMVDICHMTLVTDVKGTSRTLAQTLGLPITRNAYNDGVNPHSVTAGTTGIKMVDRYITELDIEDPENGYWLSNWEDENDKGMVIYAFPEGTFMKDSRLAYDKSKSRIENLGIFGEYIKTLDGSLDYRIFEYDQDGVTTTELQISDQGFGLSSNPVCVIFDGTSDSFHVSVHPGWGGIYYIDGEQCENGIDIWMRTIALNAMAFFSDKTMAEQVYALIQYHYFHRPDNNKIITAELASQFGLSIEHTETGITAGKWNTAMISNGEHTWKVRYCTANELMDVSTGFTMD